MDRDDDKQRTLRRHGTFHPHPEDVTDPLFDDGEFFDPRDVVQVKYEMLRRVRVDGLPVSEVAPRFGFSRPTFYQAREAFERDGIAGLLPGKRGPRGAYKLTDEVLSFADEQRRADPSLRAAELADRVQERFGVSAHPRSVERALLQWEKKRR